MKLRIDNREPDELKALFRASKMHVEYKNLAAGDFEFVWGAQDEKDHEKTVLLIERKDVDDLSASLVDGRFDEQKTKLSAACSLGDKPFPVAYLIEGNYVGHEKQSAIESVMLTTPFRDGFFVLQSANIRGTYELIVRLMDLFERGKMEPLGADELHRRFISSRAAHRGGGGQFSKQDNWWAISLGQIPGIGPQAARAIAAVYPSVGELIAAYQKCSGESAQSCLLQNVQVGTRRLGPKASDGVWRTIVGLGDTRQPKPPANHRKVQSRPKPPTTTTECLFDETGADD